MSYAKAVQKIMLRLSPPVVAYIDRRVKSDSARLGVAFSRNTWFEHHVIELMKEDLNTYQPAQGKKGAGK